MAQDEASLDSPFTTWDTLPAATRDEVVRLGLEGDPHPDIRVRRLAWAWAFKAADEGTVGMIASAALSALSGGPGDLRRGFKDREAARVIVALGDPDQS
jgi:hypothetical protein